MSSYALIRNQRVENIAVLDPNSPEGVAYLGLVQPHSILGISPKVTLTVGQYIDAKGQPIPIPSLIASVNEIPADGATVATVTYTNLQPDAPASITFDVNGATGTVALTDGVAELDITASQPGPIVVQAGGLELTITAIGA